MGRFATWPSRILVLSLILWRGVWARLERYVIMLRVFCR
jgi:hypothetical protein